MAQASGMVREAQMRLVELPLDVAEMEPQHHHHQRGVSLHSALMHKADRLAHYWESQDLGIAVDVLGLGQVSLNITLVLSIIVATIPMLWETARKFRFGPGGLVYARLTRAWVASRKDAVKAAARQAVSTVMTKSVLTVMNKSSSTEALTAMATSTAETSSSS